MDDKTRKAVMFSRRSLIILAAKSLGLAAIAWRFGLLQISRSTHYRRMAEQNAFRIREIMPSRGDILDRHGRLIASDVSIYSLKLTGRDRQGLAATAQQVEHLLQRKIFAEITARNGQFFTKSLTKLHWNDIAKVADTPSIIAHIAIEQSSLRLYRYGSQMAHISGYISREHKTYDSHGVGDHIIMRGQNGIEKYYDSELTGQPDRVKCAADTLGRITTSTRIASGNPGRNLRLSVDAKFQTTIAELLSEHRGNAIVLNPNDGQVYALHSSTSYDPNLFAARVEAKLWHRINSDPAHPLINRCVNSLYPPGSVFKLVVALAILEAGIDPEATVMCSGVHTLGKRNFHCWNKHGHGRIGLHRAISSSCNIYFYVMGKRIGIEAIKRTATILGFGQRTGIDLPFESAGLMPDKEWKKLHRQQSWQVGDTLNASIGQGYVLTSPIQLATMSARIYSGREIRPRLALSADSGDLSTATAPSVARELELQPQNLDLVRNAMYSLLNRPYGVAYGKRLIHPHYALVGKTGTAQIVSQRHSIVGREEHSLFSGYLLRRGDDTSPCVITVIVENGGWGSQSAVPLAVKIASAWLSMKVTG